MKNMPELNSELQHYGVNGMKWGIRKTEYKSMNRKQRKEVRKKYYNTPEGKIERASRIGTFFAGPLGGIIAGSIATKRVSDISKQTIDRGKRELEKYNNTKFETDEQKITKLINEGKISSNAHHYFDQKGNLLMVTWD